MQTYYEVNKPQLRDEVSLVENIFLVIWFNVCGKLRYIHSYLFERRKGTKPTREIKYENILKSFQSDVT